LIKKILIFVLIATVVASTVAIFFFIFKKGDDGILYKIPKHATSILVVDVPTLSKKLLIDELGSDNKSSLELAKSIPDSLADIQWDKSGLNFLDKLVLFTLEDTISNALYINFIIPISDTKQFDLFIHDLAIKFKSNIEKKKDFNTAFYQPFGLLLAWNNNYIAGRKTSVNNASNANILKDILSTKNEQSIMFDSSFALNANKNYDVLLYSKPYRNNPFKELELFNSNTNSLISLIHFNDGELEITTEINTKKGSLLDKVLTISKEEIGILANTDSSIVNILMNVNPIAFTQVYNHYKAIHFKESSFPYLKAWNGKINFALKGSKTIENEFITYDFDDNFNKIEIKKKKQEKIWDLQAVVGFHKSKLDSLVKINPLVKSGKDTLLFKGSDYVFKKTGSSFLTFSKKLERPLCENKTMNNNILVEVDYQKLIPVLEEFGIKLENKWLKNIPLAKFSLTLTKSEKTILISKFYFKDKKKNSLFSLVEGFGEQ